MCPPKCPACESLENVIVGQAASGFETMASDEVFRQPEYQIIRCKECALHFKHPVPDSQTLSNYYAKLEFESFESSQLFPTDMQVIKIIDQLPPRSKVLDYGCGVGRILQSSMTRLECHGVEVNQRAAQIALSRGVVIHSEDDLMSDGRLLFDAVVLTDVFEHLSQPANLPAALSKKLKPGGRLIIVTGNAEAIPDDCMSAEFWYYRIFGHLQMASVSHLKWLSHRLDMALESVHHTCHYALPWRARLKQRLQSFAYSIFRARPKSFMASLAAWVPWLRKAKKWTNAPSCTFRPDHFVAVFINKQHGT